MLWVCVTVCVHMWTGEFVVHVHDFHTCTRHHQASMLESAAGRAPTISSARALNSRHSMMLSRRVDTRCALARRPVRQRQGLWRARISGTRKPAYPSEPSRAATSEAKRQRARSPTLLSVYRLAFSRSMASCVAATEESGNKHRRTIIYKYLHLVLKCSRRGDAGTG
jgi:hypothetical protein